jgi:uncharacterized membrane protein
MRWSKDIVWHDLFEVGVAIKALNAVWETLGSLLFFTVGPRWVALLTGRVPLAHRLVGPMSHSTDIFVTLYLLVHGIINGFLAYNLFRNRLWAYPVAVAFNAIVLVYEVYRYTHTHSILLLGFAVFDCAFIALTWREYRRVLASQKGTAAAHH